MKPSKDLSTQHISSNPTHTDAQTLTDLVVDLLTSEKAGFSESLQKNLSTMGHMVDVDRAYIWQNEIRDGKLYYIQMFEWIDCCAPPVHTVHSQTGFSYMESLPSWEDKFQKKQCVNGPISDFLPSEQARLSSYGIQSILVIPLFLLNKFWGFVSFDDCRKKRCFTETSIRILHSGSLLLANALAHNNMLLEIQHRDNLLRTMNSTADILLKSTADTFESDLHYCMSLIGHSMNVDRFRIWKNHTIDGMLYCTQLYEWVDGVDLLQGKEITVNVPYSKNIPGWEETLSSGQCINSIVRDFPKATQNQLLPQGIVSLLVVPMFLKDEFWGYVSFDDCHTERVFTNDEETLLHSSGLFIINALRRNYNETLINRRLLQEKLMANISQSFISEEDMACLIGHALRRTGEFIETSRVLITVVDDETDESKPLYYWCACDDLIPHTRKGLSKTIKNAFPMVMPQQDGVPTVYCNNVHTDAGGSYAVMATFGIHSLIWAPLYIHSKYWGLLGVEDCSGTRIWNESDIQLVSMVSSVIAGAIARDLVALERAEAFDQAIKASSAKTQFLSNMSHEIRTPMNAIIGMTSIGHSATNIERKDYCFSKIEVASSHLLGVINDILDLSKIEANKLTLTCVSFHFEKMLQKVVDVNNFRVSEKFQEFLVSMDQSLPTTLIGDDLRLSQVITNLLSNAVKFTPEHGLIRLDARLIEEKDDFCTIRIDVSDTGIGISKEQQARLFMSFEQADGSTSRNFGGTGLGLSISKHIVEMMGGKIWIESELGNGSTFSFIITLKRGEDKPEPILAKGINWSNMRIMAVDDAPDTLEYFAKITESFGVQCDCATSGQEALSLIDKNGHYDIYFLDWRMPNMNGIELARRIKERCTKKYVIIMSSATEWSFIEEEARSVGVDKFLPKPLFPSAIADCLSEAISPSSLLAAKANQKEMVTFKGRCVLLAEDVETNREIVMALLEPTLIEIDCAENGMQALQMFRENPDRYDIIFMDMQMPKMDGCDATRHIRALNVPKAQTIPIVAMTANVFKEDIDTCLASGMNDHIAKPIDIDEVMDKLRIYLA
ncbi:response regulator [Lachnospiraceae bacterium ZAX-1]